MHFMLVWMLLDLVLLVEIEEHGGFNVIAVLFLCLVILGCFGGILQG